MSGNFDNALSFSSGNGLAIVKDFGAIGDGITDDTAAIVAAIATGRTVSLGNSDDTYLVTSELTLNEYQLMTGMYATLYTTSNITILNHSKGSMAETIRFEGNSTGSSQIGIDIDGTATFDVVVSTNTRGCYFKNLGGSGYKVARSIGNHQGNILSNSIFNSCGVGINIEERGEYQTVIGCTVDSCTDGIRIIGGNSATSGSVFSDCTNNVYLGAGANDAHGTMTGCAINHGTTYSIFADNPSASFIFSGCNIFAGDVMLNKTSRLKFNGCTFGSVANMYFQGSIDDVFDNCSFVTSVPTFNHDYSAEASKTHFTNCDFGSLSSGTNSYDLNGGYVQVIQDTTNLALLSSTGEQVVQFNTLSLNAITNNLAYTYETMYSTSTYIFDLTAVKSPNKSFYVDADIVINVGVASGAVDYSLINVYLKDLNASSSVTKFEAILTPMQVEEGTNPGASWMPFSLKGRVKRGSYQLIVENNSGVALVVYRHQGNNIPCKAVFSNL